MGKILVSPFSLLNSEHLLITKVQDGANKIPVGQVIAILAEEGDDLASIEVPKDLGPEGSSAPSSSSSESKEEKKEAAPKKEEPKEEKAAPAPKQEEPNHGHGHKVIKHSKPLFPSVSRLYVPTPFSLF